MIIGAGTVGVTGAHGFLGSGADVTVMDESLERLREADKVLSKRGNTVLATAYNIEHYVRAADAAPSSDVPPVLLDE